MKNLTNTSNNAVRRGFAALLLWSLILPILIAQSTWTGGAGTTNWNTSGNWTGGVPAAGKTVTINTCTTCPVITTTGNQASFVQVYAGGKLTIGSSGKLTISNPGGPGMKTHATSQVQINQGGGLTIQNFWGEGLAIGGTFTNGGTMSINGGHTGIAISAGASFTNNANGTTSVTGTSLNYALTSSGTVLNNGSLTLDDANNDGINMPIGTFTNGQNGTLTITKTGVNAIFTKGTFNNNGVLNIDNGLNGIYLLNGTFNNNTTGKLSIGGPAFLNTGIYVDPGTFKNYGELTITHSLSKGIENSSGATFENSGKLILNVPAWAGIFNVGGAKFTNSPCALIESNAPMVNYATFTNSGLIRDLSTGNSQIGQNNGSVINMLGGSFSVSGGNDVINESGVVVWTGCSGINWEDASNWYPALVPNPAWVSKAIVQNVMQASGHPPLLSSAVVSPRLYLHKNSFISIGSGGSLTVGPGTSGSDPYVVVNQNALLQVSNGGQLRAHRFSIMGEVQNWGSTEIQANFSPGSLNVAGGRFANVAGGALNGQTGSPQGVGASIFLTNQGTFVNQGQVNLPSGPGGSSIQLENSFFENQFAGTINLGSPGVQSGQLRVMANSIFDNYNVIVTPGSIFNQNSVFNNHGVITVNRLVNESGTMNLGGQLTLLSQLRINGGTVTHTGVTVANGAMDDAILNFANFQHSGYLLIKNSGPHQGIVNSAGANFTQHATGNIVMENVSNGIINFGNFANSGLIDVDIAAVRGLENSGTFTNLAGGNLEIDHVATYSLINFNTVKNFGNIKIENSIFEGITNNGSLFENNASGVITVTQNQPSVWTGITNGNGAPFNNFGTINLGGDNLQSIRNYGFSNFTNKPCATINANGFIVNQGTLKNEGLLKTTYSGSNASTGTLTNNGVIEDSNNSFNGVSFTNNVARVRPIAGTIGGIISNAIEISGMPPFQFGTTWYKNANLTDPAGSYVNGLNTFTPTIGVGTHTLYFSVKDLVNNCTKTVSIKVSIASPLIGFGGKEDSKILLTNAPNPFSDRTQIKVSLPVDTEAKLVIYDNMSRLVEVIYEGEFIKDELYQFDFNAADKRVGNYMATLILKNGRAFTLQLVKADNR